MGNSISTFTLVVPKPPLPLHGPWILPEHENPASACPDPLSRRRHKDCRPRVMALEEGRRLDGHREQAFVDLWQIGQELSPLLTWIIRRD
jgi:hypothetical protein